MASTLGFDFADRNPTHNLDQHPDLKPAGGSTHLQRNKTERRRLQGLQRVGSNTGPKQPAQVQGMRQKFNIWMINEGGRQLFFAIWVFLHLLVAVFGMLHYGFKDNLNNARAQFGVTFTIARSAALVLHVDVIFILLPVCRNFISFLRQTPLNTFIPFDQNITFHKATAWSIVVWSVVHTLAHVVNLVRFTINNTKGQSLGQKFVFAILANFKIGSLITGWLMWAAFAPMVWYAMEKRRRANFERFWYSHHLFIVFFILWQLHGMFCMIQPDRPPYCSFNTIGVFWRYWLIGGVIWIYERILREVRSRHFTYIHKVIQHPSDVMELQIKKEKYHARAGQYIFLSCPEVSYFQWHPFTLTSAPEEDYLSVHIRVVGDFTRALAKAVGCDFEKKGKDGSKGEKGGSAGGTVVATSTNPPVNRPLPRVMVDGPFGSASEDFLNYETVLLVGAGIGVTPFASILKSIWYRMNNFNNSKPTRLSKVYFTWVIRDFGTAEWFHSLLHAIEEYDTQNRIEINIYLTAKIKEDDMHNIIVQDVGAEKDAITSLKAPTHFGRPNWDRVFSSIVEKHPETDVGVLFCGPKALSKSLHTMSNKYSQPNGTRFFFGKVVGLTGGIATGKSTVSTLLQKKHNIPVIDADILARKVVEPGTHGFRQIVKTFENEARAAAKDHPELVGESSPDSPLLLKNGTLNRKLLGTIVFSSEEQRRKLNAIVHPAVRKGMLLEVIKCWLRGERVCVLDVPLLVEGPLWRLVGEIVLVYCPQETQLARLMSRDNSSEVDASARLGAQIPIEDKVKYADEIIDNSGTREETEGRVDLLVAKWRGTNSNTIVRLWRGLWWRLCWFIPPLGVLRAIWVLSIRTLSAWRRGIGTKPKKTS